jgi:hypothetical protein
MGNIYYQNLPMLTIADVVLFTFSLILFKVLTFAPRWRLIAHFCLSIGTVGNLFMVFVALQSVDAVTIEVIIMIILFSFYMLGQRLGYIYSLLNIVPIVVFMVIQYNNAYILSLKPEKPDLSTSIICILASFIIIIKKPVISKGHST